MKILAFLFLFCSLANGQSANGQQVQVVSPDGTTAPYVPQRTKTIHVHDTVNRILVVHDTLRMFFATREIERPYALNVQITQPTRRDTAIIDRSSKSELGVFGFSTFRANFLGPAFAFSLGPVRFYLTAGISYLSDYEKRQVIPNAGIAGFASF